MYHKDASLHLFSNIQRMDLEVVVREYCIVGTGVLHSFAAPGKQDRIALSSEHRRLDA